MSPGNFAPRGRVVVPLRGSRGIRGAGVLRLRVRSKVWSASLLSLGSLLALGVAGCAGKSQPSPAPPTAAADHRSPAGHPLAREDLLVASEPGISLSVRAVSPAAATGSPVLLVHGAGGGGVASFDLQVPGASLAEDLARAGHPTYALDLRGWGHSTRPPALSAPPDNAPPAVRSAEALVDLSAVVAAIRARHGGAKVSLVGWATGGHWAGMYAAARPETVAHLVTINALYGVAAPWSLQKALESSPGHLAPLGAYRHRDAKALLARWESSIPVEDHDAWRDPRVARAYAETAIVGDVESSRLDPPSVRVPSGPLHDSYLLATGTKLWSAAQLRAPVLVIRGALDFWSRPEDVSALRADLPAAVPFRYLEIPAATHFVHLDRPEHGRAVLVAALLDFLAAHSRIGS